VRVTLALSARRGQHIAQFETRRSARFCGVGRRQRQQDKRASRLGACGLALVERIRVRHRAVQDLD
jgi:hypothetical protein